MTCCPFVCAFPAVLAITFTLGAQAPPQYPPATRDSAARPQTAMVTVEGCLMREADVPGRKPNIAERAGITEDYILTSTKIIKGSAPAAGQKGSGDKPTGTAGARASMYDVKGIDDAKLKEHVGHRVQIDGSFENTDRATATPERKTPADDLVEIRGTVLRHVAAECTPKK